MTESDIQCQQLLYKAPPSIQDCYRHRKANMIFKTLPNVQQNEQVLMYNYCQCCGRIVGKEPVLRFRYDPIQAAYLGPGIPLFFALFRSVIYVLMVYLFGFGIYNTFSNVRGRFCEQNCGVKTFWNKISVFNVFNQYQTLKVQIYFELAIIILTIFITLSARSYQNYLQIYIDQFFAKPSDYCVMIRHIPQDATKEDIQEMIDKRRETLNQQQIQETEDLKIVDILMIMDLNQYVKTQKANLQAIKRHIKKKERNPSLGQVYYRNNVIPNKFARTAIVIFSASYSKKLFLESSSQMQRMIRTLWGSYYPKSNIFQIKNEYVSIYRAPEPDDLIWQNCGKRSTQLLIRRICLYALSLIVLGLGGAIQYAIQYLRYKKVSLEQQNIQYAFSLGAALVVTIFNFLISQILQFMAYHEGHDTQTQLKVAMTFRIVFFQFLNSGIFVVLTNIFVKIITDQKTHDFRKSVLSSNIVQLMTINAINQNLMTFFFNKFQVFKLYSRRKILKFNKIYPQIEANKIFQAPMINLHFKYAYILKTYWLTAFFMPAVPIVIVISSIGLTLNYWIQKYLFSGVYTAPEAISSYLNNHVLNLLDYTPLWLTCGSFFVQLLRKNFIFGDIQPDIKNFHYLFILLSIINIFLPYYSILKRLNRYRQPNINQSSYQQSVCTFQLTYQDTNPIYLNHQKKRVRDEEIFKKNLVKQVEFQEMKMTLNQSQAILKESLLNKSTIINTENGRSRSFRRVSSLNF